MLFELSGVWCSMSEKSVETPIRILLFGMIVKFEVTEARRFESVSGSIPSTTGKFFAASNGPSSSVRRPDTKYWKAFEPPDTEAE